MYYEKKLKKFNNFNSKTIGGTMISVVLLVIYLRPMELSLREITKTTKSHRKTQWNCFEFRITFY